MGSVKTVCVLGGGHGAHAVAADMALKGFNVRICEVPEFAHNMQKVLDTNQIRLSGIREGIADLEMATTDYSKAIPGADIVFVVIPAFAHKNVIEHALPYFEKGQIVVFPPGNFSSFVAYKRLKDMGMEKDVIVAEAATLPYGARMVEQGHVKIMIDATNNPIAAMPANRTPEIMEAVKSTYPAFLDGGNALVVAIDNPNPSAHPLATMLNTGRIETADTFYLYREAFSPSIHRIVGKIVDERLATLKVLGMESIVPAVEGDEEIALTGMTYFFGPTALNAGRQMIGPLDLQDRYVTEDIPFGYKPVALIGDALGVDVTLTKAVISLSSALNDTDYMKEGYSIEELGLAGMNKEEMIEYLITG
jgi:opine dehydrogenase